MVISILLDIHSIDLALNWKSNAIHDFHLCSLYCQFNRRVNYISEDVRSLTNKSDHKSDFIYIIYIVIIQVCKSVNRPVFKNGKKWESQSLTQQTAGSVIVIPDTKKIKLPPRLHAIS